MKKILKLLYFASLALAVMLTSCKKDDSLPEGALEKPVPTIHPAALGNSIDFIWKSVRGAVSYTIELSTDNFVTTALSANVKDPFFQASGLRFNTTYQSRLRANSAEESKNSEWVVMAEATTGDREIQNVLSIPEDGVYGVNVTFNWYSVKYKLTRIEIVCENNASLNRTVTVTPEDRENGYIVVEELNQNTTYTATAYNDDLPAGENFYNRVIFITGTRLGPFAMLAVSDDDIYGTEVTLRWLNNKYRFTRIEIVCEKNTSLNKTVVISEADQANGYVVVKGLAQKTNFTATGYDGNLPSGQDFFNVVAFKTGMELKEGTIVLSTGNDIASAINGAPDSASIFLEAGSVFQNSAKIIINKNIRIFSDSEMPAKITFGAQFEVSGAIENKPAVVFENIEFIRTSALNSIPFSVVAGAKIQNLKFRDCFFTNPEWGIVGVASDAGVLVDSIVFHGCIFQYLNPQEAAKRTAEMGTLPTSIATGGIAGQGLVLMNNANPTVSNIIFKNSTFFRLRMPIVKSQSNNKNKKLSIRNCTFFDLNLIVDEMYRSQAIANGSYEVENCMLSYNNLNSNFRPFINCSLIGDANRDIDHNNYRTSDFFAFRDNGGSNKDGTIVFDEDGFLSSVTFTANGTITQPSNPAGAAQGFSHELYGEENNLGDKFDVFVDPLNGDFRFKKPEHAALGIGDPRWLPEGVIPAL